uniref:Uncharacterized protein n=1 Tax=Meloidogyne incognita TaxID=6306 RepID=A0A914MYW7_MELIC
MLAPLGCFLVGRICLDVPILISNMGLANSRLFGFGLLAEYTVHFKVFRFKSSKLRSTLDNI